MGRKLCTVREISSLTAIDGADFIELAKVDGWQCVVKRGEFKIGGKVVFIEIDSVLPVKDEYSFLGKTTITKGGKLGYRLRTVKLRGQLSQGLILPITSIPYELDIVLGMDVTDKLGVWLYEPLYKGKVAGLGNRERVRTFPSFIPKTDQNRLQNKISYFESKKDEEWEVTKKLDGSSLTVWNYNSVPSGLIPALWYNFKKKIGLVHTFGVASRNIEIRALEGNAYFEQVKRYGIQDILKGHNVAIQGELIGPRIQGNSEKQKVNDFYVFDIFDIDTGEYMLPQERHRWLSDYAPKLKHVPVVDRYRKVFNYINNLDDMQRYVTGDSLVVGNISEGMVFKSEYNRVSFKVISNDYLLKRG